MANDASRYSDDGCAGRNIIDDHRVGADRGVSLPIVTRPNDFSPGADKDSIAEQGALPSFGPNRHLMLDVKRGLLLETCPLMTTPVEWINTKFGSTSAAAADDAIAADDVELVKYYFQRSKLSTAPPIA